MTAPIAVDTPVGEYLIPISDVLALTSDAVVVAGADTTAGFDRAITFAQVAGWIEDVTALVNIQVAPMLARVVAEPNRIAFLRSISAAITLGAASYLQAARFPERDSEDGYAQILWRRYEGAVAALTAALDKFIAAGVGVTPPAESSDAPGAGAAGSFPAPLFPDDLAW